MLELTLTPLAEREMAVVRGGDEILMVALHIMQAAAQLIQWLGNNPPGAGNYAYCKTGLP